MQVDFLMMLHVVVHRLVQIMYIFTSNTCILSDYIFLWVCWCYYYEFCLFVESIF